MKDLKSKSATERILDKSPEVWKSNNPFQNHPWPKEEIIRKNRKYFERNENKNNVSKLKGAAKAVLGGKCLGFKN